MAEHNVHLQPSAKVYPMAQHNVKANRVDETKLHSDGHKHAADQLCPVWVHANDRNIHASHPNRNEHQ